MVIGGSAWEDFAWLLPPLATLALGALALPPLGSQVLARGVVFIDLAVAQFAACGALAATLWLDHPGTAVQALASAAAALGAGLLVRWLSRREPHSREARIGLLYVGGASLAVLLAGLDPHGQEHLLQVLAADLLWARWGGVALLGLAAVAVLAARARVGLQGDLWFYTLLALTLTAALPLLGLYLVFALLIAPALWLRRGCSLLHTWLSTVVCGAGGLAMSAWLDWPSGACVALALAGAALLLRPRGARSATRPRPQS